MNILYVAYSCAPNSGSEDRIGWSVPLEMAKTNDVYVITKEEHRKSITEYLDSHNTLKIHFYYVDIPKIFKYLFKGFLYSARLNLWLNAAKSTVKEVCSTKNIQIVHQITPVEARAIGNYGGKIDNAKFIVGPLGGCETIPVGLKCYANGHWMTELIRSIMNRLTRWYFKASGRFRRCDYILFANPETKSYIGEDGAIQTEIAVDNCADIAIRNKARSSRIFLFAGRLIYRKGVQLLLDAIELLPQQEDYQVRIVGEGPEMNKVMDRCKASKILQDHVRIVGKVQYEAMKDEYENADVLIMPSIRETTGSVVLEALSKGLPVISLRRFGAGMLVDDSVGWTYDGTSRQEFVHSLSAVMNECIRHPEEVEGKRLAAFEKARKYNWSEKCKKYSEIYKSL